MVQARSRDQYLRNRQRATLGREKWATCRTLVERIFAATNASRPPPKSPTPLSHHHCLEKFNMYKILLTTGLLFGALSKADVVSLAPGLCSVEEMERLAACGNNVLYNIEDCQAGDTICECCALQKMQKECFTICAGHPQNFLLGLIAECAGVKEACETHWQRKKGRPEGVSASLGSSSSTKSDFSVPSALTGPVPSQPVGVGAVLGSVHTPKKTGLVTDLDSPTLTVASKLLREGEPEEEDEGTTPPKRYYNKSNTTHNYSFNTTGM